MSPPLSTRGRSANRQCFRKERLMCPRSITRSITLLRWSYFVWLRLGGDHADGMYEIPCRRIRLVVWSTAILTYLPVLPFQSLLAQMYHFTLTIFTVPMRDTEVANSKTDTSYNKRSDVGVQCHYYRTRGGLYFVRHMCYCVWWRLSGDHADGR